MTSLAIRARAATKGHVCLICRRPGPHAAMGLYIPDGRTKALVYRLCDECADVWVDDPVNRAELQLRVEMAADLYFARLQ